MESSIAIPRGLIVRVPAVQWEVLAAWAASFGLVLYLALRGGGFDSIVRGEVGVLVWWVVLLFAVIGLVPRLTPWAWGSAGALAGLAIVAALGIAGSASQEQTVSEVARVVSYLGVLLLAITLQGRAGARHLVHGVAAAIGVVTVLAVLSRFHPQAFPHNDLATFLPASARRLSYPLNYWNAQAAFMAMGAMLPLG